MWLITNKYLTSVNGGVLRKISCNDYSVLTNQSISNSTFDQPSWLIDGYVLQRGEEIKKSDKISSEMLINSLYNKYGDDFINYIKGNFIIILFNYNGFKIFSDRFAIRKYFIYQTDSEFIISDDLKEIASRVRLNPSEARIVLYSLNYHFTGGKTIFSKVDHNQPGEILRYNGQNIETERYWVPEYLLKPEKAEIGIDSLVDKIRSAVTSTLTNNKRISLSLTGGSDTRNLLAVFLSEGIKPHLYTYGDPESNDCIKASIIARGLDLDHQIHEIKMDPEIFSRRARDIVRLGGGLISIHRAHRLVAIEKESEFADYMYLGSLGGEFVKGVTEDNYIVPAVVFMNWDNDKLTRNEFHKFFVSKNLQSPPDVIDDVLDLINAEPFMHGDRILRKLNSLCYITAHLHDAQDINLYRSVMDEIYTPFLDIDYLEALFMSSFSFDNKEKLINKKLRKLENPVFASNFLRAAYPQLLRFRYSGEHKPSEVLFNKYYAALVKAIRRKTATKYPPNFPLGNWIKNFVCKNLPLCNDYSVLRETFDLTQLAKELKQSTYIPSEAYWLKFTNPIMMRFIIEEFTNG